MAYMSQEKKAKIQPVVKKILEKYGLKGRLSVHNHSTLILKITSGKIDFCQNWFNLNQDMTNSMHEMHRAKEKPKSLSVNPYWYHEHFTGRAKSALADLLTAMNNGNHDNSDAMTDYFDVGWYVNVEIGTWDKPYEVVK